MRALYEAMSMSARTNRGFTLVELLVVVGIIAILAAIAIPQFNRYRRDAAAAAVQSDARNCVTDAVASITQSQIVGSTIPTGGSYGNRSPQTASCNWTFNTTTGLVSCTCNGQGVASGISCTAQQTNTGFTVSCSGI